MTQMASKTKGTPAFKVGDNVVYPTQGAGRIIGQVEKIVAGEAKQYFEIELMKGSMRVNVPVDRPEAVGLRRITDAKRIPGLLGELKTNLELPEGWTPRHRREQQLLAEGDIFVIAQLVGTLSRRDFEKPLSVTERRIMDEARHMVATEVAMATGVSVEEADERIGKAL
jgi:CarD family transcriptional regulator